MFITLPPHSTDANRIRTAPLFLPNSRRTGSIPNPGNSRWSTDSPGVSKQSRLATPLGLRRLSPSHPPMAGDVRSKPRRGRETRAEHCVGWTVKPSQPMDTSPKCPTSGNGYLIFSRRPDLAGEAIFPVRCSRCAAVSRRGRPPFRSLFTAWQQARPHPACWMVNQVG